MPTDFQNAVKNAVVYGSSAGGTTAVVPNLTTDNVNVAVAFDASGIPTDVTVSITGYTVNALFGNFTFNKPVLKMLYLGPYCSTSTGATC